MVASEQSFVIGQFDNRHISASADWIKACIEWCKAEHPNSCKTHQSLTSTVLSQWLDTDLRAEGIQSRPQLQISLLHLDKLKAPEPLNGTFNLQLMGWHDISKPAFSQLQTLKKTDNENSEVTAERTQFTQVPNQNDTSKRMLKLELNDGFSTINAIEHEYCGNKLKEANLRPGTKLRLIGPLHVRRGMILLYPRNIEVLGGYVEEMESEAGLEHRLESVLNPESSSGSNASIAKLPTQTYHPPENKEYIKREIHSHSSATVARNIRNDKKIKADFIDEDDAIFSAINTEVKEELPDRDDDIFQFIETNESKPPRPPNNARSSNINSKEITSSEHQLVSNETPEKKLKIESSPETDIEKISSRPFQYLSTVPNKAPGTIVTIKGCVVTVVGKLSVKKSDSSTNSPRRDPQWHVLILVTDGSDTIKASLSPQILENWIEVSPILYMSMADDGKSRIKQNIQKVSEKLMSLNAIMKVCFTGDDNNPEITEVTEINRGHTQQLKIRQK